MFQDDPMPDVRSDVFSLAATIYTILAGQTPFEVRGRSNGTLDLIGRIERGAITPLSREDVPRSLVAVLRKGMASDRNDRYASAVDFARALQRVELELGYAPTPIDVPNLDVDAPSRSNAGTTDDADETRARTVATITVQEPNPLPRGAAGTPAESFRPPLVSPPGEPGILPGLAPDVLGASGSNGATDALESTRLRSPITVRQTDQIKQAEKSEQAEKAERPDTAEPIGQTVLRPRTPRTLPAETAADGSDSETIASEPRSRRAILLVIAAIVVIIVAAAIILVPKLTAGTPAASAPSVGSSGGAIDVSSVPTPVFVSAVPSADGTSVTFTWSNPKPKAGDSYLWAPAETPSKRTPVAVTEAVVSGVTPGSKVCINVEVLRDGTTSANPLAACTS
jgi:hypothetical protein